MLTLLSNAFTPLTIALLQRFLSFEKRTVFACGAEQSNFMLDNYSKILT